MITRYKILFTLYASSCDHFDDLDRETFPALSSLRPGAVSYSKSRAVAVLPPRGDLKKFHIQTCVLLDPPFLKFNPRALSIISRGIRSSMSIGLFYYRNHIYFDAPLSTSCSSVSPFAGILVTSIQIPDFDSRFSSGLVPEFVFR